MLNIRFREKTNTWPGFVDLFSNLVIILIFLLIVFVFLWTTTSVFNKNTGMKTVAELKKTTAEQEQTIAQMSADEQEAKRLLILARGELENLDAQRVALADQTAALEAQKKQLESEVGLLSNDVAALDNELNQTDQAVTELVNAYEAKIAEMQASGQDMSAEIENLRAQLTAAVLSAEQNANLDAERRQMQADMEAQRQSLSQQLAELQTALDAADARASAQEIQYVEMSTRLNRALADKIAELNKVSAYQSEFYKAIKMALGDRTSIRQEGDRFIVSSDILFASGEYTLSAEGKNQLHLIANVIRDLENKIPTDVNWIIRVDGHTDKKPVVPGNRAYKNNIQLSLLRATAVANELARDGVSQRRLVPSGFGELHPIELGNDPVSLQKNRRIELQLTNR